MTTPPYAFGVLYGIQLHNSTANFTVSDAGARSSDFVSRGDSAGSMSGPDTESGWYITDDTLSSASLAAEIVSSDNSGSLRSGTYEAQSRPNFAGHATASEGTLPTASDVADVLSAETATDWDSDLVKLDGDHGKDGLILASNSLTGLGIFSPVSGGESENPIDSALGAQSGSSTNTSPLTSPIPQVVLELSFVAPPVSAAISRSPDSTNIVSHEDFGEAAPSIVQSSSGSNLVASGYDASVVNAPVGLDADVASVTQSFESDFTNPITFHVDVGSGGIDGQALPTATGSETASSSAVTTASTNSVSATGSSPSWVATLQDSVIRADMTAASAGGTVSETGMAQLFADLAAELTSNGATLSTSQLSDLRTIASDLNVGETASSYITYITDALILGNAANATWTGGNATTTSLGDLAAGSTATELSELTGKWFLGTDLPSDAVSMTGYSTFTVSYSADTAPLYGTGGPSINDVNQGFLGDCYLMACLAEAAHQDPSLITSMITANGNNTFGVRFVVNGAAEYVTVSNTLADDGTIFNYGPAIWASLIEQAYAQLQAGGVVTGNNINDGNSWSTIGNGGAPEYALAEITGATQITDFSASNSSWKEYAFNNSMSLQSSSTGTSSASVLSTVTSDLTANDDVILSSNTNAYASNGMLTLVADHAFSIYGYDSATGDLELRNPWGTESGQTWDTTFEVALSTLLAAGDTITIDNVGSVAINTSAPSVTRIVETPSSGDLNAGKSVTITLDFSTTVTVSGTPTLTLNDGGTATYSSGSGSTALSFTYTIGASDSDVTSLAVNAVNLNGATIADSAGNAQLSLSGLTQSGPQIDTTIPKVSSIVETPSSGAVTVGEQIVFTLNLTEDVTVSGTPTLTLNDGGVATFSGGSGSSSLSFSYIVAAGNTDVAALTASTVNLNGGSIEDGAGNNANLALSGVSQTGPQVAGISTIEVDEIYQAVLQRAPTAAEVATWLATEPPAGEGAVISALVDSAEAQQYVYPVIQIIKLATGMAATSGQVDGWVNAVRGYVAQDESLAQALTAVALAFTNDNTAFENEYGTTSVSIIKGIYANAFGTQPTPTQISAWSVDTPAEILYAFATSTVYSNTSQSSVQQYLTAAAQTAVEANSGTGNGGSSAANTTYVDGDYLVDTLVNSAAEVTNTYNFGNFATLEAGGFTHGNAVVNMVGANPELDIVATAAFMLDDLTYNGTLVLDSTAGAITVISLTDTTTDATISLRGSSALNSITIGSINDIGLTVINAADSIGAVTLGTVATPLSQVDLTVLGGTGTLTVVASGAGDIISELATSTAGGTIKTTGAGDSITAANGANTITAAGANDLINLGVVATGTSITAAQTIHAMGANDIIAFASTAADGTAVTWAATSTVDGGSSSLGIGPNDKIIFGNNVGTGSETIVSTGDVTGATTSGGSSLPGIAMITLENVVDNAGDKLVFNNAINEMLAGPAGSNQVSVTGAASLGQALDIAAADAALSQKGALIAAQTGVIDWFQYANNTYVVETINSTSVAAAHTTLTATDEVLKIVGLGNLSGESFVDHTLTL